MEKIATLKDEEGRGVDEVRGSVGYRGELPGIKMGKDYYAGFVELHIEQGPLLEAEEISIGVVKAIAGARRVCGSSWRGRAGMRGRR